jgi:hypothetical protein
LVTSQLQQLSAVVAGTGDIEAIARFKPMDATTNPPLLLKAAAMPAYAPLLDAASVTRIWQSCKRHDYGTLMMGASFRNTGEVRAGRLRPADHHARAAGRASPCIRQCFMAIGGDGRLPDNARRPGA